MHAACRRAHHLSCFRRSLHASRPPKSSSVRAGSRTCWPTLHRFKLDLRVEAAAALFGRGHALAHAALGFCPNQRGWCWAIWRAGQSSRCGCPVRMATSSRSLIHIKRCPRTPIRGAYPFRTAQPPTDAHPLHDKKETRQKTDVKRLQPKEFCFNLKFFPQKSDFPLSNSRN